MRPLFPSQNSLKRDDVQYYHHCCQNLQYMVWKAQEIWGGFDVSGPQQFGINTYVNTLSKYITKKTERKRERETRLRK
jgi:hypothetical protein